MSWLSDHLFGTPKSKDDVTAETGDDAPVPPTEIQNDTVTTSNAVVSDDAAAQTAYENREVAAEWQVPVRGKLHKVEFEHGTTSGKRILWVDGKVVEHSSKAKAFDSFNGNPLNLLNNLCQLKEVFHRDWMFKLVGDDLFELDGLRCVLRVNHRLCFFSFNSIR